MTTPASGIYAYATNSATTAAAAALVLDLRAANRLLLAVPPPVGVGVAPRQAEQSASASALRARELAPSALPLQQVSERQAGRGELGATDMVDRLPSLLEVAVAGPLDDTPRGYPLPGAGQKVRPPEGNQASWRELSHGAFCCIVLHAKTLLQAQMRFGGS